MEILLEPSSNKHLKDRNYLIHSYHAVYIETFWREGEEGPDWVIRSQFEDKLANFMLKKDLHAKGLREMLDKQRNEMHNQFSQIIATLGKSKTPMSEAATLTLAIITRSRTTTHDPPYPNLPRSTLVDNAEKTIKRERPNNEETPTTRTHEGISELKPTRMSIQLADRSVKYPIGVCENLLVKINKFIFPANIVVLEMDEDETFSIILGRTFLVTARAVIDVHDGKLCLRVRSETVTFNIGKYMRAAYLSDDYLYCADHTTNLVYEQWVDTLIHDGK
uniref:Reverse transcriptase domain-containing protein n=1 Tax=Tanacetum cinerariifolium TaxID=118510 RepID=A0A699HBV8_TANCI|nr:hypothetical protein [Tanacetum cinerariifolium]